MACSREATDDVTCIDKIVILHHPRPHDISQVPTHSWTDSLAVPATRRFLQDRGRKKRKKKRASSDPSMDLLLQLLVANVTLTADSRFVSS